MAIEFWSGTNGPGAVKKSDLSFNAVTNPGCMAVRDETLAYVGGADTGGVMVESLTSVDDYATPTDISGSLDTAKPITGLETT